MTDTERTRAELTGCSNCGCVGRRIPEETGQYAFDDIGSAMVCVTESGDVIVHYREVGE